MRAPLPADASTPRSAFTVIELMLAVAIMTVIFIALYTVFDVTQKALRNTMSQVDVLENIRATTDLMVRDLERAVPLSGDGLVATSLVINVPSRSVLPVPSTPPTESIVLEGLRGASQPILSTSLQELFFFTRKNDRWTAVGYWVGPITTTNLTDQPISVGRLYRFSYETNSTAITKADLYARFNSPLRLLDSQPVMDGVVHLRVQAYDAQGEPMIVSRTNRPPIDSSGLSGSAWFEDPMRKTETAYKFLSSRTPPFPSALELEIGVLEPQMVTRYNSIPLPAEARKYVARNAGKVHVFRQRIPLRNAPQS